MNEADKFALVPRLPGALEKAEPGTKRVLAGMVQDALALARTKAPPQIISPLPSYTSADLEMWFRKGKDYYFGNGVSQDYTETVKWWRNAAERGYAKAQYSLGLCYDHGHGVSQDYAEAAHWCRKAAEQGNAVAQFKLGTCYGDGHGLPQDAAEALRWYRKAAEQGLALAQYSLGLCYHEGNGVPQDLGEAFKWFKLGVNNTGIVTEQERKCLTQRLAALSSKITPDQLQEGERRYREFKQGG